MQTAQNILIEYFSRITPLSNEEIQAITANMLIKTFPKGSVLLEAGHIATEAYFVIKGCVRQYYAVDGEERITNFFTEEEWIVSSESMSAGVPARHYLVCCEETILVIGDYEREEELFKRFPRLESI